MPREAIARILELERAKIQKALEDLERLKPELTGAQQRQLEEIEETLRLALLEK
ncbi:MAG: hypothetical protein L0210_06255 [Rhodospirillales bacterium]|nr:hypothetical protein [Rhodospirillales bacterium]